MDIRFAIAAALAAAMALAIRPASPHPAKSRLRPTKAEGQPAQSLSQWFAKVIAELNAYLLILALGLAALDLVGLAIVNLPDAPAGAQSNLVESQQPEAVDPAILAATAWRF